MIPLMVVVALAILAGTFIAWPVLSGATGQVVDRAAVDPLDEALDRSLDAIREIEFDHATGHLSDDDFAALDAEERGRALELMRRRDAERDGTEPA